ncbi:hypothetical protein NUACC21_40040 [Scytonema sp. NUACC21]
MTTTTTTNIEQQSLNQDFVSFLMSINFEVLNDMEEIKLDDILSDEFKQGLASDIIGGL